MNDEMDECSLAYEIKQVKLFSISLSIKAVKFDGVRASGHALTGGVEQGPTSWALLPINHVPVH